MSRLYRCAAVAAGLLVLGGVAITHAQSATGTISGSVVDTTRQVLPGATVTLRDEQTGATRTMPTSDIGTFTFSAVQAGRYTVRVELSGFRASERTNITLPASEQLSIGAVELQVGGFAETVTTTAEGSFVQAVSSDRSAVITDTQLETVAVRGRNVISLLSVLPGVTWQPQADSMTTSNIGTTMPNIAGTRNGWNTITVDGLPGNDLGSPQDFTGTISFDAIGEVKVQLTNYTADSGRNGGAQITLVTKSGSQDFKGSLYNYTRHEGWNANNFFNKRDGIPKPRYRSTTLGVSLGGPLLLPKNAARNKLFFFYLFENWDTQDPQPVRQITVPTALERSGDFSQSRDLNGNLIVIRDPVTGQPYPGNRIPAGQLNRNGQALLNVYPLPNALDRSLTGGSYNYQMQQSHDFPRRQNLLRIDYRPSSADSLYGRYSHWWHDRRGHGVGGNSSNWGFMQNRFTFNDYAFNLNYTRILTPTLVNEVSAGRRYSTEANPALTDAELDSRTRAAAGYTLGQFHPEINPFGLIPMLAFGSFIPNAASANFESRFVNTGSDTFYVVNEALSWLRGKHNLKFGLYYENVRNVEGRSANAFSGLFDFSRDTSNPLDTGHPYANAAAGVFRSYTEQTTRPGGNGNAYTLEWFAQDTWKATSKLTAEVGVRFGTFSRYRQRGPSASFALDRFDSANAPTLYQPFLVNGTRMSRNPVTGEIGPAVLIGALVAGTGDIANGMVLATDATYPAGFQERPPLLVEPRVGFAYDFTGDGKTALRANVGVFHNTRSSGSRSWTTSRLPPIQFSPSIFYGTMNTFLQAGGVSFPSSTQGMERDPHPDTLYSYTIGMQRDIGWGTVVDAAYVGTQGRHLEQQRSLNTIPFGARFLPENQDPTRPGNPLPDNFFRPYPGWGDISYFSNDGKSDYNALQLQANRRYIRGLQFGVAYTWSRSRDYTDPIPLYSDVREWTYGLSAFDRTHQLVINYTWDLPKASALLDRRAIRAVFDNWILSGMTTFASGTPASITFTTVDNADILGGGDSPVRVLVTGDPNLPRGDRSLDRWFETSVFARPAKGQIGNGRKDDIRLPGVNDTGITIAKRFPFGSPQRFLQVRWEIYNLFNQTQFLNVDTTARFDARGNQVNERFGKVISARSPRVMQGSLRFTF